MDVNNSDFTRFVEVADANKLEYILIGGLAMILNGAIRFTQDADIWLKPTNQNRDQFVDSLIKFGYDEEDLAVMRETDFTQPHDPYS